MNVQRHGTTVTVGDLAIEPIERVLIHVEQVGGAVVGFAERVPVALVLRSPTATWRVRLEAPSPDHASASEHPSGGD